MAMVYNEGGIEKVTCAILAPQNPKVKANKRVLTKTREGVYIFVLF